MTHRKKVPRSHLSSPEANLANCRWLRSLAAVSFLAEPRCLRSNSHRNWDHKKTLLVSERQSSVSISFGLDVIALLALLNVAAELFPPNPAYFIFFCDALHFVLGHLCSDHCNGRACSNSDEQHHSRLSCSVISGSITYHRVVCRNRQCSFGICAILKNCCVKAWAYKLPANFLAEHYNIAVQVNRETLRF